MELLPKKGVPPVLPETLLLRTLAVLLRAHLFAIVGIDDDDDVVARSREAELLARLALDNGGIFVVLRRLHKAIMPDLLLP